MKLKLLPLLFLSILCSGCFRTDSKLPVFNNESINSGVITNQQLIGKIIVVNVWATWCGPCVYEIPYLNTLVEKYKHNNDVVFLGVTDESVKKVENFLIKKHFDYAIIPNAGSLKNSLHPKIIKSIPWHIIFDKSGEIIFEYEGANQQIIDILSTEIDKALLSK